MDIINFPNTNINSKIKKVNVDIELINIRDE